MRNSLSLEDYPRFKKAYEKAVKDGVEVFEFDGTEILVAYAKYVCEYFEIVIKSQREEK